MKSTFLIITGILLASALVFAWPIDNPNRLDGPEYAWLAGSWIGDGFGGTSEEIWSKPAADGTMMGVYRHFNADGTLNFYEFMVMDQSGLRLKHFTPDLVGWETKEDFVTFEMIKTSTDKIELKGLVFEKMSDTELEIRLRMKRGDKIETEVFNMKRM